MTEKVVVLPYGKTALDVAILMNKDHVGSIIIVNDNDHPDGIITEKDLVRRVIAKERDPKNTFVKEIMSKPLLAVNPNSPIEEAVKKMKDHGVKRLAVIKDNILVGIVSEGDITKILPVMMELLEENASQ